MTGQCDEQVQIKQRQQAFWRTQMTVGMASRQTTKQLHADISDPAHGIFTAAGLPMTCTMSIQAVQIQSTMGWKVRAAA